jgi:hypothetical protein
MIVKSAASFILGALFTFSLPSLVLVSLIAISLLRERGPLLLTGLGPICMQRETIEKASPNGRLIAISVRMWCEDETSDIHNDTEVFVFSTRLDRGAHLLTLKDNGPHPAPIMWSDNRALSITKSDEAALTFAAQWCGVWLKCGVRRNEKLCVRIAHRNCSLYRLPDWPAQLA